MGEDLKIGANLTWGPCFDYQKQFFTGTEDKESRFPFLLRYDIEVSGFGSHKSGHLCLLKLKEQMYPGGDSTDHWPTLCLNTLKWAKKQGALTGPAHSGWGLQPPAENEPARGPPYQLRPPNATAQPPNFNLPPLHRLRPGAPNPPRLRHTGRRRTGARPAAVTVPAAWPGKEVW